MEHDVSPPFWRSYPVLSRLGWTAAALLVMWPAIVFLLALFVSVSVAIVAFYPIVHFMWGMKPDSASDNQP